jgi:hypothetical protein
MKTDETRTGPGDTRAALRLLSRSDFVGRTHESAEQEWNALTKGERREFKLRFLVPIAAALDALRRMRDDFAESMEPILTELARRESVFATVLAELPPEVNRSKIRRLLSSEELVKRLNLVARELLLSPARSGLLKRLRAARASAKKASSAESVGR